MLGLNSMSAGACFGCTSSEISSIVNTELSYLSCQPGRRALVWLHRDMEHTGEKCSVEADEHSTGILVRGCKGSLHEDLVLFY